jgi:hypothetical protein
VSAPFAQDLWSSSPASVIQVSYDRTGVPPCRGGFSEVWKGVFRDQEVAIKVLKVYLSNDHEQIRKVSV